MGMPMAANLIKKGGFDVTVWNRSLPKCNEMAALGALVAPTPAEVVASCSIVISMLADPNAVEEVYFGSKGALESVHEGSGIVDMSTVDADTSLRLYEAVHKKGGKFLAAPVSGSKKPAEDGQLVIMAGGDRSLFELMQNIFSVIGKKSIFLGDVTKAAEMKLVVNMIMGGMMAAFAEGLNLAEKTGLQGSDLLDVLDLGAMSNPMFRLKGPSMIKHEYTTAFPLQHQQKDLRLVLELARRYEQDLPIAQVAYGLFRSASSQGLSQSDFSAVSEVLRKPVHWEEGSLNGHDTDGSNGHVPNGYHNGTNGHQ